MKNLLLIGLLLLQHACLMSQSSYYDCYELDIAGVKLGMDAEKAVDILIEALDSYPNVSLSGVYPESRHSYNFNTDDGVSISVIAHPSIPFSQDELMQVTWIRYTQFDNEVNRSGMVKRSIEKYGQPSFDYSRGKNPSLVWCSKPASEGIDPLKSGEPFLQLFISTISLGHSNYEYEILKDYFDKFTQQKSGF